MNAEDLITKLAERARLETPPTVDVADRVIARLRAQSRETPVRREPLVWVAAASAAVAVAMLVLARDMATSWSVSAGVNLIDLPWWLL